MLLRFLLLVVMSFLLAPGAVLAQTKGTAPVEEQWYEQEVQVTVYTLTYNPSSDLAKAADPVCFKMFDEAFGGTAQTVSAGESTSSLNSAYETLNASNEVVLDEIYENLGCGKFSDAVKTYFEVTEKVITKTILVKVGAEEVSEKVVEEKVLAVECGDLFDEMTKYCIADPESDDCVTRKTSYGDSCGTSEDLDNIVQADATEALTDSGFSEEEVKMIAEVIQDALPSIGK